MAKPKAGTKPPVAPARNDDDEPLETAAAGDEELGTTEDLEELLEELGAEASEARAIVYSVEPNKEREECMRCPLSVFSVEELRTQFGPGNYQVWVYYDRKLKRRIPYRLKAPRTPLVPPGAPASGSSGSPQALDLPRLLSELDDRQRRSMEPLLKMNEALIAAVAGRAAADPNSTLDQAIKLAALLAPKGDSGKSLIETLLQGMKLGQARDAGGGSIWAGVLDKAIDKMAPLVDAMVPAATARAAAAPDGAVAPALEAPAAAPTVPPPGDNPVLRLLTWLQAKVREFVPLARAGKSPALYAEVILDQVPAGITPQQLHQALKDEGAIDALFSMLPNELRVQALPCRPWFMALREELLEYFDEAGNLTLNPAEAEDGGNKGSDVVV